MRRFIIPVFINNQGCPFRCSYCNQFRISSKTSVHSAEKVVKTVETYLSTLKKSKRSFASKEIAFFGGTFTGLPLNTMINYLEAVKPYVKKRIVDFIRISTHPLYINSKILKLLKDYEVKVIELGIQSLDNEVLKVSNRGYSSKLAIKSSLLIKEEGFLLGHQLMVGLPASSFEKDIESAKKSSKLNPEFLRIYPTLVVKNTLLEKWYNAGKYTPLSVEETVLRVAKMLFFFKNSEIMRIGLHYNQTLLESYVAGPLHPSLGSLCYEKYFEIAVKEEILNRNLPNAKVVCSTRFKQFYHEKSSKFKTLISKKNIFFEFSKDHPSIGFKIIPLS